MNETQKTWVDFYDTMSKRADRARDAFGLKTDVNGLAAIRLLGRASCAAREAWEAFGHAVQDFHDAVLVAEAIVARPKNGESIK